MPTSHYEKIPPIMEIITELNPQSILDVGTGFGKYGVLCREYLELWDSKEQYKPFRRRIDGIEIFKDYITPLHDFIYNNIYIGNVLEMNNLPQYDLVLLIDIIEHIEKQQGKQLIKRLLEKNEAVLVVTPKKPAIQKEMFNNPYESHISKWTEEDLSALGETFFLNDTDNLIACIGNTGLLKKIFIKRAKRKITKIPFVRQIYKMVKK